MNWPTRYYKMMLFTPGNTYSNAYFNINLTIPILLLKNYILDYYPTGDRASIYLFKSFFFLCFIVAKISKCS